MRHHLVTDRILKVQSIYFYLIFFLICLGEISMKIKNQTRIKETKFDLKNINIKQKSYVFINVFIKFKCGHERKLT